MTLSQLIRKVMESQPSVSKRYQGSILCQPKSIEILRRNIKSEIGDHLYCFEPNTLNQARAFEGEF